MTEQFGYVKLEGEDTLFRVYACDARGQPTEDCAFFRWIDASRAQPPSGKSLEVFPLKGAYEDFGGTIDSGRLLAVLRFCFNSVLELTSNLSDKHVCKLYCADDFVHAVYSSLAEELGQAGLHRIEHYGRWIEIWNK